MHSAAFMALCHEAQKVPPLRRVLEHTGLARDGEQWVNPHLLDEAMLASCRDEVLKLAHGRETVVLLIPARGLWLGDHQTTERQVHERFAALLRAAGLQVADPVSALERGGQPLSYYFKADPHWNAAGHRVAADVIGIRATNTP